jgi:hypothetical protein
VILDSDSHRNSRLVILFIWMSLDDRYRQMIFGVTEYLSSLTIEVHAVL